MKKLNKKLITLLCVCFIISNCKAENTDEIVKTPPVDFSENYEITKQYDRESNTYYYLTRIKNRDKDGNLIKLRLAIANQKEGETVRSFAVRMNSAIAINASMGLSNLPPNTRQPAGIQIVDGEIIQELSTRNYTLGIKDNNELVLYSPGTKAVDILGDGAINALTGFIPLIIDHNKVSDDIINRVGNSVVRHPRQVIAQFDNLDLLFLSCGGRGFEGDGMTAEDLIRILKGLDVRFAFNLDGGGSVSTVIGNELITPKIDGNGTRERLRPNFLYIMDEYSISSPQ